MGRIKKRFSAFTLLELIVVIAIITVLTAIAVPSLLTRIRNSRIQAANDQAQSLYMAAQDYLISLQRKGVSSNDLKDYFPNSGISANYGLLKVKGASCKAGAAKSEEARKGILSRYQSGTGDVDIGCWIVYVYRPTFTVAAVFYNEGRYNDDPMKACEETARSSDHDLGPFKSVYDGSTPKGQEYSAIYHDTRAYTGQYPTLLPEVFYN